MKIFRTLTLGSALGVLGSLALILVLTGCDGTVFGDEVVVTEPLPPTPISYRAEATVQQVPGTQTINIEDLSTPCDGGGEIHFIIFELEQSNVRVGPGVIRMNNCNETHSVDEIPAGTLNVMQKVYGDRDGDGVTDEQPVAERDHTYNVI